MSSRQLKTSQKVDLTNCDTEPIQIPGAIQPHGVLFVLQEPNLEILQVSNNTLQVFNVPSHKLINKNLSFLLGESQVEDLKKILSQRELKIVNPFRVSAILPYKTQHFDGIAHRIDGCVILELEPISYQPENSFFSFYNLVRSSSSKIQSASNLHNLCQIIVREVRQISGFDRVMVYKFDEEGNGEIIAEEKQESLPPFLGLHYPVSDIPKQARLLYCSNWLRLIANVNYLPVEITPQINPVTEKPLDLSFSVLRSVSPIHIEYLNNMGVSASMSISLMKGQKLWGLIACHHQSPKYVCYEVRKACEFLGQVMSLDLSAKEENEDYDYKIALKSITAKLIERMSLESKFVEGLCNEESPNLLDLVSAQGAAVCLGGECRLIGETPAAEDLNRLLTWLTKNFTEEIIYTDSLAKIYPEAEAFKDTASGLLAISISQTQHNYVIWFRSEEIQTVNWAGNPHKPVEVANDGTLRLSPRGSFKLWQETVKYKSLPWKKCETEAALELRNGMIKIVLRKADELAKLNEALQESESREREKANQLEITLDELKRTQTQLVQTEKMSSLGQLVAGMAHEINNPVNFIYGNLTHADNYTQDLVELLNLYTKHYPQAVPEIQEETERRDLKFVIEDLPKLLKSMKVGADRIRSIVQSLRTFSRVDEAEMKPVNIHDGLDSTLLILSNRLKPKPERPSIQIIKEYGELPLIECYAGQLNQVFMNVLANAIDALEEYDKHRSLAQIRANPSQITISTSLITAEPRKGSEEKELSKLNSQFVAIRIADNGPGIPEELQQQVFDPFFTTKAVGKGAGIGLAISYQIVVEKHGGNFKCVSQPNGGTEFWIEIPLK
ncbi:ATP-binding protein [Microcoleus sp. FACHB-672]|uniref:ATP-binding protein n=1 Tax=Microcoleus sp. FACHB-672 TaxID=2692825 RepID=UPI001685C933|nr:ATP-binding protein [Microcoleus sp. FACHB-672]MBD2043036.1 GAF domain-containing protein [Microcoleus sp. FACHB-672]